jgi:hypothetical protein
MDHVDLAGRTARRLLRDRASADAGGDFPATRLDGFVPISYHVLSHLWLGCLGFWLGVSVLDSYYIGAQIAWPIDKDRLRDGVGHLGGRFRAMANVRAARYPP